MLGALARTHDSHVDADRRRDLHSAKNADCVHGDRAPATIMPLRSAPRLSSGGGMWCAAWRLPDAWNAGAKSASTGASKSASSIGCGLLPRCLGSSGLRSGTRRSGSRWSMWTRNASLQRGPLCRLPTTLKPGSTSLSRRTVHTAPKCPCSTRARGVDQARKRSEVPWLRLTRSRRA